MKSKEPQGGYDANEAAIQIPLVIPVVATEPPLQPITFPPKVPIQLSEVPPVPMIGIFLFIAAAIVTLLAPSGSDDMVITASILFE